MGRSRNNYRNMGLDKLYIKDIIGVDEFIHPEKLPDNKCAILRNLLIDTDGLALSKRGGFQRFSANAIDTTGDCINLFDTVDSAGTNFVLGVIATKLRKSSAGTAAWSDVKTGLTSDKKTRIASLPNSRYCLTNGFDKPYVISGVAFAGADNLEIGRFEYGSLSMSYVLELITDGLQINTTYSWVFVYATEDGEISNASLPLIQKTGSGGGGGDPYRMRFTNIPVSSDTRVTQKRVYRTEGNGARYYLLKNIPNADTSWDDYYADDQLDLTDEFVFTNAPTKAKYNLTHKERLFLGNLTKTYKNAVKPIFINTAFEVTGTTATSNLTLLGVYKYKLSFLDVNGRESELGYEGSVTLAGTENGTIIDWGFIGGKGSSTTIDKTIDKVRIYRTLDAGSTYYWLDDVDPDTDTSSTGYEDTLSDATLATQGTYPKSGEDVDDTVDLKCAVMFSDILRPSNIGDANIIDIFPDDADEITGLVDDVDGVLVFKTNSICKIFTEGSPANWRVYKLIDFIGCNQPETLFKKGSQVYFFKDTHCYRYPDKLDLPISLSRQDTFKTIISFHSSTFYKEWYIVSALITSTYYLFCYDTKFDTWYELTALEPKALLTKQIGTNAGNLWMSNGNYVFNYSPTADVDHDVSGSDVTYSVLFRSKTFSLDGIRLMRLRELLVNYNRSTTITFKLGNPDTAVVNTQADGSGTGLKVLRQVTDGMTVSTLKSTNKVYFEFEGVGLSKFLNARIDYIPKNRGYA
jgi:hypothetical protein